MTPPARAVALDANILIRLVLGQRVRDIVLEHVDTVAFFAPRVCFEDARRYLPGLLARRGVGPAAALAVLDGLEGLIHPLQEKAYAAAREDALARIATRDEQDRPILAAALTLNCPIWTEDRDFFGAGVPTWTTDRVQLYLGATTD